MLPLHGELPGEQQDAALLKQPRRKIVLATNVAETSVTVEGVTAVVATGLARIQVFDPAVQKAGNRLPYLGQPVAGDDDRADARPDRFGDRRAAQSGAAVKAGMAVPAFRCDRNARPQSSASRMVTSMSR